MIDIWMLMWIIGKDGKNIEHFLFYANYKSAMFIGHFRDIILSEFKLVYFALFYKCLAERFASVVCPAKVRF